MTAASYEFDEESFEDISDQAKDFISSLLKKDRRLVSFLGFKCIFVMQLERSKGKGRS